MSQRLDYSQVGPVSPHDPHSATPFLLQLFEHTCTMSETVCSAVRVLVP
jgi:hypothetical protein